MNMIRTSGAKALIFQRPSSDQSKSIYGLDIVDDIANQNIGVCHESTRDHVQAKIELFNQKGIEFGRFLPNEQYLMMPSGIGFMDLKYLEELIRAAGPIGIPSPIPKEDIPCNGGLVFVSIRDLTYSDAMREIKAYIKSVGHRRVYISELAEELQIDMDLIEQILNDIRRSSGIDNYV